MIKVNADTRNTPDRTGGCWPTPHQELLLRAALLPKEPALAAWRLWRSEVDIEEEFLDLGSFRLLPMVFHNLKQHAAVDSLLGRLRGIHHRAWVQNQIQFNACVSVLSAFKEAGIETLVLKGAALSHGYYPTHGVRPMGDFDVLVPTHQASQSVSLLTELGWHPTDRPADRLDQTFFAIRHAQGFATQDGRQLDLHWHVLVDALDEDIDQHFWSDSIPLTIHNVDTRALNATDMLLHVCVHGAAWAPVPPVRWVADAMMVLRHAGDQIDWNRLVVMADECRVSLTLGAALTYLHTTQAAPIPSDLLARTARTAVSEEERRLFRATTQRSRLFGMLPVMWRRYQRHLTRQQLGDRLHGWIGFPRYVAIYKNMDSLNQVWQWAIAKGRTRLIQNIGPANGEETIG